MSNRWDNCRWKSISRGPGEIPASTLEFAREKREINGKLIAEFVDRVIDVRSEEDCFEYDGIMYRCLLCDFASANRGAIGGHVRWKQLGRR